jgi:hypothetical protein
MPHLTAARPQPRVPHTRIRSISWEVIIGLAVVLLAIGPLVRGPRFVDRLTIENPLPFDLSIDVTNAARDGWMGVAIVSARTRQTTQDVVDQGRVWIFRVQSQGAAGGEFRVSRSELDRAGWRLTISPDVETRLRSEGAPSACRAERLLTTHSHTDCARSTAPRRRDFVYNQ